MMAPKDLLLALVGLNGASIFAVVYLAFVATLVGYGLWSRLMSRYPAAQVAQFSLLVPIVKPSNHQAIRFFASGGFAAK